VTIVGEEGEIKKFAREKNEVIHESDRSGAELQYREEISGEQSSLRLMSVG
jgi:hypothetical protein